jgi:hypothetical protein
MATEPHELFSSKVKIESPTGCWIWAGTKSKWGHGVFAWSKSRTGAHRYSWEWFNGRKIPNGMMVIHSCNVPECVNPLHLRVGTQFDNMADRKLVGNYLRGERHVNALLTNNQARAIFEDQRTCNQIAKTFGVKRDVVQRIRQGQTYVNATGGGRSPYQKDKGKGSWNSRYPLVPWGKIRLRAT